MNIKSSRVLLIGATGGIGSKIAESLQSAGADLYLSGRNQMRLDALKKSLREIAPQEPHTICADITTEAGRLRILDFVRSLPAGINTLINCAGINHFSLLEGLDQDVLQKMIDTNLTAPLQLIRQLLPQLRKQREAHLINIGSSFGSIGFAGFSVYCATKFALRGFTEALRRELADTSITVSYIAPRATETELNNPAIVSLNQELKISVDQPQLVAEQVLHVLMERDKEVYIGWPEKFFIKLNSVFPRLVDKALQKQLPVIKRHAHRAQYSNSSIGAQSCAQ